MRPKRVILCVDADEAALAVRVFLLQTKGWRVLRAAGALEAMRVLEEETAGAIDLLVTELDMPEFDGNELCRRGKVMHPEMRTLIMSRRSHVLKPDTCSDVYLSKAASCPTELCERIRVLLVRKRGPKGPRAVLSASRAEAA